jgi:hypothetical protein
LRQRPSPKQTWRSEERWGREETWRKKSADCHSRSHSLPKKGWNWPGRKGWKGRKS